MMARSRPRARIAALKAAARFAPEAVRITSETAPIPIPTAAGWVRRQCSVMSVAIPTTTATLLVGGVDHDAGQGGVQRAGQAIGEACCRLACHRSRVKG